MDMQAFLEENVTHSAKSIKAEQDIQVCIFLSCIPLQTLLHTHTQGVHEVEDLSIFVCFGREF